jgi:hypothetical protein
VGTAWFDEKLMPFDGITRHLPRFAAAQLSRSAIVSSTTGIHPNELAGTLVLLLPPTILIGASLPSRAARVATLLIAGVMLVVLLLTQSRSGWFGLLAAAVAWGVARLGGPRAGMERLAGGWRSAPPSARAALTLFALAVAVIATRTLMALAPSILLWLDSLAGGTRSGVSRIEVWMRAADILQEFPLTGVGLNTFPFVLATFFPSFRSAPGEVIAHAHNQYLAVLMDVGPLGFLALALLGAIALRDGATSLRLGSWPGALARGCVLGLVGFCCYGLTDAIALGAKPGLFVWLELGALSLAAELARRRPVDKRAAALAGAWDATERFGEEAERSQP